MDLKRTARPPVRRALLPAALLVAGAAMLVAFPQCAHAASGKRSKSVGDAATSAVTQPLQDLNLAGDDVPTELLLLRRDPYSREGLDSCEAIDRQIATLEEILGPDVDKPRQGSGRLQSVLRTGGKYLGGFIPFRGVVREISGANMRKERMEDAVYVGVARRSYLKGMAAAKGCQTAEERAIAKARTDLGMLPMTEGAPTGSAIPTAQVDTEKPESKSPDM